MTFVQANLLQIMTTPQRIFPASVVISHLQVIFCDIAVPGKTKNARLKAENQPQQEPTGQVTVESVEHYKTHLHREC